MRPFTTLDREKRRLCTAISLMFTLTCCGILKSGTSQLRDARPDGTVCLSGSFQATNSISGTAFVIFSSENNQWYLYLENLDLPETGLRLALETLDPPFSAVVTGQTGNKTFTIPNVTTSVTISSAKFYRSSDPTISLSTATLQRINSCGITTSSR